MVKIVTSTMTADWGTLPLDAIRGTSDPHTFQFSNIKVAHDHSVLFTLPCPRHGAPYPFKATFHDKWDNDHVKMPFSDYNLYNGKLYGKNKRWDIIKEALKNKKIRKGDDLRRAIIKYNGKYDEDWHFTALLHYLDKEGDSFFKYLLPKMVKLAINLPEFIQAPVPLLKQGGNKSVSLSQLQISSLLANAFFCTFPQRNSHGQRSAYGSYSRINFCSLFNAPPSRAIFHKLKCIFNYFERVCNHPPTGVVTFSRRSLSHEDLPRWQHSHHLTNMPVRVDADMKIENAHGIIQVDFANKFIGGGVLGRGQLQEEIRFLICPELIASMLIVESLKDTEALMVIGVEQYCRYEGYGDSFEFAGDYFDETPRDRSGRRHCTLLAIDATHFHYPSQQFEYKHITRELNKAYVGFSFFTGSNEALHYPGVATGNWGCGAFGGHPLLKALIQLMACAVARRPMAYLTFGDYQLRDELLELFRVLLKNQITVGTLYEQLTSHSISNEHDLKRTIKEYINSHNISRSSSLTRDVNYENSGQYTYSVSESDINRSRYRNREIGNSGVNKRFCLINDDKSPNKLEQASTSYDRPLSETVPSNSRHTMTDTTLTKPAHSKKPFERNSPETNHGQGEGNSAHISGHYTERNSRKYGSTEFNNSAKPEYGSQPHRKSPVVLPSCISRPPNANISYANAVSGSSGHPYNESAHNCAPSGRSGRSNKEISQDWVPSGRSGHPYNETAHNCAPSGRSGRSHNETSQDCAPSGRSGRSHNETSQDWAPSGSGNYETSSSAIGAHSQQRSVSVPKRKRGRRRKR